MLSLFDRSDQNRSDRSKYTVFGNELSPLPLSIFWIMLIGLCIPDIFQIHHGMLSCICRKVTTTNAAGYGQRTRMREKLLKCALTLVVSSTTSHTNSMKNKSSPPSSRSVS